MGSGRRSATYPTHVAAQRLKRQRRPIQSSVMVVNLATGEKKEYPKIRRFAFSGESAAWIALQRYGPDAPGGGGGGTGAGGGRGAGAAAGGGSAPDRPRGTDLILRDLANGAELNVGNVSEFSFRKDGKLLALAIDAQDKAGNGLQLRDMTTGAVSALDSGERDLRADHVERQGRRARGAQGNRRSRLSRQVLLRRRRDRSRPPVRRRK